MQKSLNTSIAICIAIGDWMMNKMKRGKGMEAENQSSNEEENVWGGASSSEESSDEDEEDEEDW